MSKTAKVTDVTQALPIQAATVVTQALINT